MSIRNSDSVGNVDAMPIYCAICENKCSPLAKACPKCGHPLTTGDPTQVIEQTAKRWKRQQLLGGAIVLLAVPAWMWGTYQRLSDLGDGGLAAARAAAVIALVGFGVYCHARLRAWWHHG